MRKIIILIVVVILAVAGFTGWKLSGKGAPSGEAPRLIEITIGDIDEQVTAQGKLEAKEFVDVGTQVSGQIKKLHVDIGDDVKAGDLLVEIDPKIYQTRVAAITAHLKTLAAQQDEQQSNLILARRQHDRNKQLIKSSAVSRDALEQSEAAFKAAQAKVASLQAQKEESQSALDEDTTNLAYTKINAPMSGTVVDRPMREGQTVNASQTAPTILSIADLSIMTVRAQVAEADIMRVKEGMSVYFTTMGQMEKRWTGVVRQILPTPEIISNVVLYNVLVDAENKDRQLMNSMSTQVFFTIGAAHHVPLIPVEALTRPKADADNNKGMAYIVKIQGKNKAPEDRLIHVGLMDRTAAEVRAGLTEGDIVILPPLSKASPSGGQGMRIGPRL
jgi:macrolide-specific efflux system membrane fusion protein